MSFCLCIILPGNNELRILKQFIKRKANDKSRHQMDEAPSSSSFPSSSGLPISSLGGGNEEIGSSKETRPGTADNRVNFIQEQQDKSKYMSSSGNFDDDGGIVDYTSSSNSSNVGKGDVDNIEDMEMEHEDGHSGDKDITTVDGIDSVSKSSDRRDEDEELEDDDDGNASTGMDVISDLREYDDNNEYRNTTIRSMERLSSVDTLNTEDQDQDQDIETEEQKMETSVDEEEDNPENRVNSGISTSSPDLKVEVPKTEEEQIAEDMASLLPVSPKTMPSLPSLRGTMVVEGNPEEGGKAVYIFKGIWALSGKAHANGNTADFEYTQVQPDSSSSVCFSGKYSGYFYLKQGKNLIKHNDIVDLKFEAVEGNPDKVYDIVGNGKNSFGKFLIQGEMKKDQSMMVYKIYLAATPKPRSKRSETPKVLTPRESTPRQIKERQILEMPPVRSSSGGKKEREEKARAKSLSEAEKAEAKKKQAIELMEQIELCKELHGELMNSGNARWFLEPVDPIKMHLPDYFSVVKQPMDLGTVKTKFSNDIYETPEQFCADMRLIFRNAMTYNHQKDNPVHVAAKDMLGKFEEKFRALNAKFKSSAPIPAQQAGKPTSLLKKSSSGRGGSSGGVQRSSSATQVPRMRTPNGPRTPNSQQFTPLGPPGALESDAIAEMSQKMAEMQEEMVMLRTALIFPELLPDVALTREEQATLVSQIQSLPPEKIDIVIEIIQANAVDNKALAEGRYNNRGSIDGCSSSSSSSSDVKAVSDYHTDLGGADDSKKAEGAVTNEAKDEDNDSIDIPLHALDIKTLRSLQTFVRFQYDSDQASKKQRNSGGSGVAKKRTAKALEEEEKATKLMKIGDSSGSMETSIDISTVGIEPIDESISVAANTTSSSSSEDLCGVESKVVA